MNQLSETQDRLNFVRRIHQLRATSTARWGKMSVDQMLKIKQLDHHLMQFGV